MSWYTAPAALAILNAITARPAIINHSHTYVITTDRWCVYDCAGLADLTAMWKAEVNTALHTRPFSEAAEAEAYRILDADPQSVLCALWGTVSGMDHHGDEPAAWAAIRADIALASLQVAA
jgi:hypothetical protein